MTVQFEQPMPRSALLLFAPKFAEFGVDVARVLSNEGGITTVHGLCSGSPELTQRLHKSLGELGGQMHCLPEMEADWLATRPDPRILAEIRERYPAGTAGRTLVADRRIGIGYNFDGATRPDLKADTVRTDPMSLPDAYLSGLYGFLHRFFDETSPDVVFCYAVAGAPARALWEVCQARGIPFGELASARIGARYMIGDTIYGDLLPAIRRMEAAPETLAPHLEAARAHLDAFRARPEKPEYQRSYEAKLDGRLKLSFIARRLRQAAGQWRKSLGGNRLRREAARRKAFEARMAWAEMRLDRSVFAKPQKLPESFVYYPLHVSPERSTMVLTPFHTSQLAVIEGLSKALPAGMSLVVKEHRPMLGRRPKGYYETIAGMPRTLLLGPEYDGLSMVAEARLTAVITGTAAWEAMQLGRVPLVIGTSPILSLNEGAVQEQDLSRLPEAIEKALSMPPISDDRLTDYIASLLAESFEMPADVLWTDYLQAQDSVRDRVSSDVAHGILRLMDRGSTNPSLAEPASTLA